MVYEIETALKTIRQEGVSTLAVKICLYFWQMVRAIWFTFQRKPHDHGYTSISKIVHFAFTAAGGLIAPDQHVSELTNISNLVAHKRPIAILEIGTATGGTLLTWCAIAPPDATIISIDLPGGIHGGGYAWWRTLIYRQFARAGQRLHLLRENAHNPETVERVRGLAPDGIDFLFLDADHTYWGVKAEFDIYAPMMRPGGIICICDICKHPEEMNCQVDVFWNEIKGRYKSFEIVESYTRNRGYGFGIIEV